MHEHHPIKLHISHNQVARIRAGHPVQIKHEHIGHAHGSIFRHLHPTNLEKIHKAHRGRRGVRVHLTHAELHGTGLLDSIKKGVNFVRKHAGVLKPIASAVLDAGAHFFPEASPLRQQVRHYTGVGIHGEPQHFSEPTHFPGGSDFHMAPKHRAHKKKSTKKKVHHMTTRSMMGHGIVPAGFSY